MRLYYMTTAKYAMDNVNRKRVKVSLFNDLNDPFELLCAKLSTKELRKGFLKIKNHLHARMGVICFSTSWRSPVMWSHYADKHKGICLGFDVPDEFAIPIRYVSARDAAAAEAQLSQTKPDADFAERFMTTKYDAWSYENERRLYVGLEECDPKSGMYFYDFGSSLVLKEIILGPRCETTLSQVRKIAAKFGKGVVAYKARLAFNTFDVVPNKNTLRGGNETT